MCVFQVYFIFVWPWCVEKNKLTYIYTSKKKHTRLRRRVDFENPIFCHQDLSCSFGFSGYPSHCAPDVIGRFHLVTKCKISFYHALKSHQTPPAGRKFLLIVIQLPTENTNILLKTKTIDLPNAVGNYFLSVHC